MKLSLPFVLRWLSPQSFRKFFDTKDFLVTILPSSGFYYEKVSKFEHCTIQVAYVTTIVIGLIILFFSIYNKYSTNEKAIAEVLETGYFTNFIDKTVGFMKVRKNDNMDIVISFSDKSPDVIVKASQLKIKIILPQTNKELIRIVSKIDKITKPATMAHGPWVNVLLHEDNTVTVFDCPRTLLSLRRYVDTENDEEFFEKKSKVLHKYFNKKFMSDWNKASADSIPSDIFQVKYDM